MPHLWTPRRGIQSGFAEWTETEREECVYVCMTDRWVRLTSRKINMTSRPVNKGEN